MGGDKWRTKDEEKTKERRRKEEKIL